MNIVSIGVDLCDIPRLSKLITEHGDRFLKKVFTAGEISYCSGKVNGILNFAARFAAKEALLKALGTGLRAEMNWKDVEVLNDALGKPYFKFYGQIAEYLGERKVLLSLAHTADNALAFVLIEGPVAFSE
jgi:holo-[acyl-carrier protein] synthase